MKKLMAATLLTLILLTSATQAADEGIKVHGHWKFEIYNPDGSFERKVEFENALTAGGNQTLTFFLLPLDTQKIKDWFIVIGNHLCNNDSATNSFRNCFINSIGTPANTFSFPTLQYKVNPAGLRKFIMNGSFTVSNLQGVDTAIASVSTNTIFVDGSYNSFTLKDNLNIPVSPGQLVQVSVEISIL